MPMALGCTQVGKTFDVRPLFEGLDLGIAVGDRVGLIGPNGSGKSTLLAILAGLMPPDEGERALASGLALAFLPQRDGFEESSTAAAILDQAWAARAPHLDEHQRQARVRIGLTQAGFDQGAAASDRPVSSLSGGWRKRLAIIRALAGEPDLLLMDEPTNHLDLDGIWWLERLLADLRATIVVVSHDRFFLERVASRVVELNRLYPGGCFSSDGGYSAFVEKRAEFMANQLHQQSVLDNKVRREVEWLRMNPAAQTRKSKARIDQAFDLQARLGELRFRNAQTRRVEIDFTATGRRANELVTLEGVSGGIGGKILFSQVDLTLAPGSRLGVLGFNGSGKTTFLRVLAGALAPSAGRVKHAVNLKVVVFDQKRERLDPSLTLRRALCPTGETVIYRGRGMHVAAWAKRFLFTPVQLDLEVGRLSGGEQARVLIADLMRREADLLILDEPTNDLDIPSLEVLEESLIDFPGAVALVTHDRYLLDRVSTSILALDGEGGAYRVADCAQWEDLAEHIQAGRQPAAAPPPPATGKVRMNTGMSSKEKRELAELPGRIEAAEAAVAEIEARIADPTVSGDPAALQKACTALAARQAEVEALYARWGALEGRG